MRPSRWMACPLTGDAAAARVGRHEAGQVTQQRRLARARRTQQGHHLARLHRQADIVERLGAGAERLAEAAHLDRIGHVGSPCRTMVGILWKGGDKVMTAGAGRARGGGRRTDVLPRNGHNREWPRAGIYWGFR